MSAVAPLWIDVTSLPQALEVFGIAPLERLRRTVRAALGAGYPVVLSGVPSPALRWPGASCDATPAPLGARLARALQSAHRLVALEGGLVIDPRLIAFLSKASRSCVASRGEGMQRSVALYLDANAVQAIPLGASNLASIADALLAAGVAEPLNEQAFPAYMDKLRRSLPYWIYRIQEQGTRAQLERRMFWDNYKGSTDLLTAYVYPPLVWPLVRLSSRWHVHPNVITVISIIMAFAAVPLFAKGAWLAGFLCAYLMSVLDSVDGKVARLTLTDSKIGNVLDHGLDQVHPPFWYYAWAWGLGGRTSADPLLAAGIWLIVFYFADRIVLGIAKSRLGHALHASSVLDEKVRGVIARRNITMTVMAIALLVHQGPAGLFVVTLWQGLTFLWHSWRTLWLGFVRPPVPRK